MRASRWARFLASLLLAVSCGALPAAAKFPEVAEPSPEQRARAIRSVLHDTRGFLRQRRADAAERTARIGLAIAPEDARLHRLLAQALAAQGDAVSAAVHRDRADALDPPPAPLPQEPVTEFSGGLVVALVPPGASDETSSHVPHDWPEGVAGRALAERLRLRLPAARVEFFTPESVETARAWLNERSPRGVLSLRVERSYCTDTLKDGFFAVAQLRIAAEIPHSPGPGPEERRLVLFDPRGSEGCEAEALGRAFERVLRHASVRQTLAAPDPSGALPSQPSPAWSTAAIRALFPCLGERIQAELRHGRDQLGTGRIAAAAETFQRAAQIDPEDAVVQTYLAEVEATLAMAAEIPARSNLRDVVEEDRGVLDPRFSPAQREAAESRLKQERRRRSELLAAHELLRAGSRAPTAPTLATLRSALISDTRAFGPATAMRLVQGEVRAQDAAGPDGTVIARYYTARSGDGPLLREEDDDGDGRPDQWTAYKGGIRSDAWEDGRGDGVPDVHFEFAADGETVARIELDTDGDGETDRVMEYESGTLSGESRDTNVDGILDRFDHFDADGFVTTRDEDLDGDGEIDVRTTYRSGRMIERALWK